MLSALIRIPSSETLRSQRLPICQVNSPFRSAPAIHAARSAAAASAFLSAKFIISLCEFDLSASPALREREREVLAALACAILYCLHIIIFPLDPPWTVFVWALSFSGPLFRVLEIPVTRVLMIFELLVL
jgi:hypothetical protein